LATEQCIQHNNSGEQPASVRSRHSKGEKNQDKETQEKNWKNNRLETVRETESY
jgi:hypothetical protein